MGSVFTSSFSPYELVKWLRGFKGVVKKWVGDDCYPFGSRGSDSDDGPIGALLVPVSLHLAGPRYTSCFAGSRGVGLNVTLVN